MSGRSHCETCGHQLSWWELVPVIGCLVLRARCRECHTYFGYRHAVTEGACGMGVAVLALAWYKNVFPLLALALFYILWFGLVAIYAGMSSSQPNK